MKFVLVDQVIEQTDDRIVAVKFVSLAEEYLADHFPSFPVLPGVLMIETMVQAARRLAAGRAPEGRAVLGSVRALKFGSMVRPGEALRVTVTLTREHPSGSLDFKGSGVVIREDNQPQDTAVSGRFTLRKPLSH